MRLRAVVSSLLVGMFAMLSLPVAHSAEPAVFKSVYAAHDVALETNPDSAFWREAVPVFAEVDNFGHPLPHYKTEVLSRWTNGNLYLLFICPYEELYLKPNPNTAEKTGQLWNWDVAEAFIGSDFTDIRRYKEFEVSPQGEWIDLDINLDTPHNPDGGKWRSGFTVSARIDRKTKTWYGAMRIPFSAIDANAPKPGAELRINLFRCQGPPPDRTLLTWQASMSQTFHVPERFGLLKLVTSR